MGSVDAFVRVGVVAGLCPCNGRIIEHAACGSVVGSVSAFGRVGVVAGLCQHNGTPSVIIVVMAALAVVPMHAAPCLASQE